MRSICCSCTIRPLASWMFAHSSDTHWAWLQNAETIPKWPARPININKLWTLRFALHARLEQTFAPGEQTEQTITNRMCRANASSKLRWQLELKMAKKSNQIKWNKSSNKMWLCQYECECEYVCEREWERVHLKTNVLALGRHTLAVRHTYTQIRAQIQK